MIKTYPIPDMQSFIQHKYWTLFEAVLVLTGWPAFGVDYAMISPLSEEIKDDRDCFYVPSKNDQYKSVYEKNKIIKQMFEKLQKAIEMRLIFAKYECLFDRNEYFVSPKDVIKWALLDGIRISDDLQNAIGVHLMDDYTTSEPILNKVKNKIIAQCLLQNNPTMNRTDICKDEMMKLYGSALNCKDTDLKTIRRTVNELYESKGQPGRPSVNSKKNQASLYIPKPISEVLLIDENGILRYHYNHLKIAFETIARIKSRTIYEGTFIFTMNQFKTEFFEDSVLKLYIKDASDFILEFAKDVIENRWSNLVDFLCQAELCNRFELESR